MPRRALLFVAALVFFSGFFSSPASGAQSEPLHPASPALKRTWAGDRLIAANRLSAQVPSAFGFMDQSNRSPSTLINCDIVQITDLGFPIDVSGTAIPRDRICTKGQIPSERIHRLDSDRQ